MDVLRAVSVCGVISFGFFDCRHQTKIVYSSMVVIMYEYAFPNAVSRKWLLMTRCRCFYIPLSLKVERDCQDSTRLLSDLFLGGADNHSKRHEDLGMICIDFISWKENRAANNSCTRHELRV